MAAVDIAAYNYNNSIAAVVCSSKNTTCKTVEAVVVA